MARVGHAENAASGPGKCEKGEERGGGGGEEEGFQLTRKNLFTFLITHSPCPLLDALVGA